MECRFHGGYKKVGLMNGGGFVGLESVYTYWKGERHKKQGAPGNKEGAGRKDTQEGCVRPRRKKKKKRKKKIKGEWRRRRKWRWRNKGRRHDNRKRA